MTIICLINKINAFKEVSKLSKEKNSTINEELNTETNDQVELTEEEAAETVFAEEEENNRETGEESTNDEHTAEIQQLINKLEEADNRYLRLQADFDNFRRRSRS